jgi:hypothetical protein
MVLKTGRNPFINLFRILRKSGTFEINSGHFYKKGDCPGKHRTNGNPKVKTQLFAFDLQFCGLPENPAKCPLHPQT